jgi:pyruvate formate lyase activating enzyme
MEPEQRRPLIFDIHHFALDDGPGIRTTVFFKGCPLACLWCHNPEGIQSCPELFYYAEKCIGCGDCAQVCPTMAISMEPHPIVARQRCNGCGVCARSCPSSALTIKGTYYTPTELVDLLLKDKVFFDTSGGGVTFSGGEPTMHLAYLEEIACRLKAHGVHIALQTCGHFSLDAFSEHLLPYLDVIFFDIKCMDPERHRHLTGQDNRLILRNFDRLVALEPSKLVCTVPVIQGLNADEDNLRAIAARISAVNGLIFQLNPYHPGGLIKAAALGKSVHQGVPESLLDRETHRRVIATFGKWVGTPAFFDEPTGSP